MAWPMAMTPMVSFFWRENVVVEGARHGMTHGADPVTSPSSSGYSGTWRLSDISCACVGNVGIGMGSGSDVCRSRNQNSRARPRSPHVYMVVCSRQFKRSKVKRE